MSGPPSANRQLHAIQVLGAVEHGVSRGVQYGDSREENGDNPGTEAEGARLRGRDNRRRRGGWKGKGSSARQRGGCFLTAFRMGQSVLRRPVMVSPDVCSLTVPTVPSYCDYRKCPLSISQRPPGLGAGVLNGLQMGGDPGRGLLGPGVACTTLEFGWTFRCLLVGPSLSSLSQAFHGTLRSGLQGAFALAVPGCAGLGLQTLGGTSPESLLVRLSRRPHLLGTQVPARNLPAPRSAQAQVPSAKDTEVMVHLGFSHFLFF